MHGLMGRQERGQGSSGAVYLITYTRGNGLKLTRPLAHEVFECGSLHSADESSNPNPGCPAMHTLTRSWRVTQ